MAASSRQELFDHTTTGPSVKGSSSLMPLDIRPSCSGPSNLEQSHSGPVNQLKASTFTRTQSTFSGFLGGLLHPVSALDILEELDERKRERMKDLSDPLRCVNVTRVQHIDTLEFEETSKMGGGVEEEFSQSSPRIGSIQSQNLRIQTMRVAETESEFLEQQVGPMLLGNVSECVDSAVMMKKQLGIMEILMKSKNKELEQMESKYRNDLNFLENKLKLEKEERKSLLKQKDCDINLLKIDLLSKEVAAKQREEEMAKQIETLKQSKEALQHQLRERDKKMTRKLASIARLAAEENDFKSETNGEYVEEDTGGEGSSIKREEDTNRKDIKG